MREEPQLESERRARQRVAASAVLFAYEYLRCTWKLLAATARGRTVLFEAAAPWSLQTLPDFRASTRGRVASLSNQLRTQTHTHKRGKGATKWREQQQVHMQSVNQTSVEPSSFAPFWPPSPRLALHCATSSLSASRSASHPASDGVVGQVSDYGGVVVLHAGKKAGVQGAVSLVVPLRRRIAALCLPLRRHRRRRLRL